MRVAQSRDKTLSFHCSEVQTESKLKFILAPCSFEKSISENFDFLEMDDNLSEPLSHVVFFVGQKFRVKKRKNVSMLLIVRLKCRSGYLLFPHVTRQDDTSL